MTEQQEKNIKELMDNIERYYPLLNHVPEPIRTSMAKYYPALKRLAEE
jgi:hypothetical protein